MISLWYLVIGLVFGTVSSIIAKRKNRHAENWFTLGLFFWVFAATAIYYLDEKTNSTEISFENTDENEEFSFPY